MLALAELDPLLEGDPDNPLVLDFKAIVLSAMGRHAESMLCRRRLVTVSPNSGLSIKYGWSLRSLGDGDEASLRCAGRLNFVCPRRSLLEPGRSQELRFADEEAMQAQLARRGPGEDRMFLHFALGKAFGDKKLCESI